jgi:hypothetical protein
VPGQVTSPSTVPTTYAKKGEAKEGAGSSQDTWRRLTATSWNGTSVVAGPLATPCPRSRDGLPDRDDVPDNVRRVPAKWVRPQWQRLAMLVSWPGTGMGNLGQESVRGTCR